MTWRLLHAEHGRHARIGVLEVDGPFIPGAGAEDLGEPGLGLGPATLVVLRCLGLRLQAELADQRGVKPRFDSAHGHVLAVCRLVDLVVRRPGIREVRARCRRPAALRHQAVEHRRQQRRAVRDRRVHDLTASTARHGEQRADDAVREDQPAAAHVADQVHRRQWPLALPGHLVEGAGQGDVVDVMPGRRRQRAVLPPAGHPAENQPRVTREADIGPQAKAFHDPGPESLDEGIGLRDHVQQQFGRPRRLEVDPE